MIDDVRESVIKQYNDIYYKYHVSIVVEYAKHLAKIENVDEETVELGALLHDIGKVKHGGKDHDITGVYEAEQILKQFNYSADIIEIVKGCVRNHRASKKYSGNSKIEMIIRDADAISHFDTIPYLLEVGLKKHNKTEKAVEWLYNKLKGDWNNKMHFAESKTLVSDKYKAAMLLLESTMKRNREDF